MVVGRIMAIDHGRRRIGIAVGDDETRVAFARPAVHARSAADAVARVAELARAEASSLIVVGLPLHADGSEGEQVRAARAFGGRLAAIGLRVTYRDERLSSWQAAGDLEASRRRPDRRSGELDSAAARVILQDYLDAKETR